MLLVRCVLFEGFVREGSTAGRALRTMVFLVIELLGTAGLSSGHLKTFLVVIKEGSIVCLILDHALALAMALLRSRGSAMVAKLTLLVLAIEELLEDLVVRFEADGVSEKDLLVGL